MNTRCLFHVSVSVVATAIWLRPLTAATLKVPEIVGPWWTVAGDPDLGAYTSPEQQPVDFAVWQAGDGTWQLWSCIRKTKCGGHTRLFHRWEGRNLTDAPWTPMGIAMEADPAHGESPGGLQAPYVLKIGQRYVMFYGDWTRICIAESDDGKVFRRRLNPDGTSGLFGEGPEANARDAMVLFTRGRWHGYYTAHPNRQGAVYCRTSPDTYRWSDSRVVAFAGAAGVELWSAECPHVVELAPGEYYLFRTQRYGEENLTRVYYSSDPLQFGINRDERHLIASLAVAAPEIIRHKGEWYLASLLPSLQGIRLARLQWVLRNDPRRTAE